MAYNFDISPLNPLKFYPLSEVIDVFDTNDNSYFVFDSKYNYKGFDQDFYLRNIPVWDEVRFYAQPYQQSDILTIQFLGVPDVGGGGAYGGNPYTAYIIDCNNQIVKTIVPTSPTATLIDGQKIREIEQPLYDLNEGYYRVVLRRKKRSLNDDLAYSISEVFHVKQVHEYTNLVTYTNTKNAQGIIFEYGFTFQVRLHGYLGELEMQSKFNVYEDEPLNMTLLSSVPYRLWTWYVGGNGNLLPDYMGDKLERQLGCDTLTIDGISYTRGEGSKWEVTRRKGSPLNGYKIQLRESSNDNSMYYEDYQIPLVMGTAYDTSIFFIEDIEWGATTKTVDKFFRGQRNFLDYLNGIFKSENNMLGTFAVLNGAYVYMAGSTAELSTFNGITISNILPYAIELGIKTNGANNTLDIIITSTSANYAISWGNGTQIGFTPTSGTFNASNTYATDKSYTMIIAYDAIESFDFTNSENIISSIGGDIGDIVESFAIRDNNLRTINNDMFKFVSSNFVSLDLSGNKLLTSSIDSIVKMAYTNISRIQGCAFLLDGQIPTASCSDEVKKVLFPTIISNNNSIQVD